MNAVALAATLWIMCALFAGMNHRLRVYFKSMSLGHPRWTLNMCIYLVMSYRDTGAKTLYAATPFLNVARCYYFVDKSMSPGHPRWTLNMCIYLVVIETQGLKLCRYS